MPKISSEQLAVLMNAVPYSGDAPDRYDFLLNQEYEANIRQVWAPTAATAIKMQPVDVKSLAENEYVQLRVSGHPSTNTQRSAFWKHPDAAGLIGELVGNGTAVPSDEAIDKFIDAACLAGFSDNKGKAVCGNARLLASVLLACVWPKDFVEFQPGYWQEIAKVLAWNKECPKGKANGPKIRWAAELARTIADTDEVKAAFKGNEPMWAVAGLLWKLKAESVKSAPQAQSSPQVSAPVPTSPVTGKLKSHPPNLILCGPPGTGKTYSTYRIAVEICDSGADDDRTKMMTRFRELQKAGRIEFVTFHPSYAYEDFVEGIRPVLAPEGGALRYECWPGIFREMCSRADASLAPGTITDFAGSQVWKMSLGNTLQSTDAGIYEECLAENVVRLGYGTGIDFEKCTDLQSIRERLDTQGKAAGGTSFAADAVDRFKNRMKKGDLVVISNGNRYFRAIGKVTGAYRWDQGRNDDYDQVRDVTWLKRWSDPGQPVSAIMDAKFSQQSIYNMTARVDLKHLTGFLVASHLPHVVIIDEINRGNLSKVFGELITCLEADKRIGGMNETRVRLPYSHEELSIPNNLFVLGTMNTADRSISLMDFALRRRFEFHYLKPDFDGIRKAHEGVVGIDEACQLFEALNDRIMDLKGRDFAFGHSYLYEAVTASEKEAKSLSSAVGRGLRAQVIPLILEYFYEDWRHIIALLGKKLVVAAKPNEDPDDGTDGRCRLEDRLFDDTGENDSFIYDSMRLALSPAKPS